jgi:hypothetical protein
MATAWFLVALVASCAGYAAYLVALRNELVEPNRASWLIWSAATTVEAATYAAVNPHAPQRWIFLFAMIACGAITLALWRRSAWSAPSRSEALCMGACLSAILLWTLFRDAFWAHMLIVAAVPVSFWPTWRSVRADPGRERSPAWGLWTVGDLATLLVASHTPGSPVGEYAYVLVELTCHASVWLMIGLATINPLRSFGLPARHAPSPAGAFTVGDTHLGKAVFAARGFVEGETLLRFTGRRLRADRVPSRMRGPSDRFVQVAPGHYMGPSGRIDDLVNHSCTPNAGLRFAGTGIFLIASRDIAAGEEISWDYSTTLAESNWHMICQCRSPECRRVIGNFSTLSPERQEWFRARNLVAPYLRRKDEIARPRRAA